MIHLTKRSAAVLSFVLIVALVVNGAMGGQGGRPRRVFDRSNLDETCEPCRDFYQYANGGWMKKNPIPPGYECWRIWEVLKEANLERGRAILEAAAASKNAVPGSNERIIGDLYASCMDEAAIEAVGLKPLEPLLNEVQELNDMKEGWKRLKSRLLRRQGVVISIEPCWWDPGLAQLSDESDRSKEIREKFTWYVARKFELMGATPERAAAQSRTVLEIETKRSKAWQLEAKKNKYEKAVRELKKRPIEDWRTYLSWRIASKFVNYPDASLPKNLDELYVKYAEEQQLPRWRRCLMAVKSQLDDAFTAQWVEKHYPVAAKAAVKTISDGQIEVLRTELATMNWMGQAASEQAIKKLEALTLRIGHPEKWRDYSKLKTDRSSYLSNLVRVAEFEADDVHRNLISIMRESSEWLFTPVGEYAYYQPRYNQILIPAGILQPPILNFTSDNVSNYGAIGAVVGHEILHGFQASIDKTGDKDKREYKARAACIEQQYSAFKGANGLSQNGKSVSDEAIADLGGLRLAYLAWKKSLEGKPQPPVINGFTAEQRFFLSFAQIWAMNATPEYERKAVQDDEHPLNRFRVNGTLSNMPEFAAAFGCKKGDAMVRETRCGVWW
jgi:putative endopeptidase